MPESVKKKKKLRKDDDPFAYRDFAEGEKIQLSLSRAIIWDILQIAIARRIGYREGKPRSESRASINNRSLSRSVSIRGGGKSRDDDATR